MKWVPYPPGGVFSAVPWGLLLLTPPCKGRGESPSLVDAIHEMALVNPPLHHGPLAPSLLPSTDSPMGTRAGLKLLFTLHPQTLMLTVMATSLPTPKTQSYPRHHTESSGPPPAGPLTRQ